jgi:hypothetical protein
MKQQGETKIGLLRIDPCLLIIVFCCSQKLTPIVRGPRALGETSDY